MVSTNYHRKNNRWIDEVRILSFTPSNDYDKNICYFTDKNQTSVAIKETENVKAT